MLRVVKTESGKGKQRSGNKNNEKCTWLAWVWAARIFSSDETVWPRLAAQEEQENETQEVIWTMQRGS